MKFAVLLLALTPFAVHAAPEAKPLKIMIATPGSEMAFDKTKLTAKPGQKIQLTFENKAQKNSGMSHNWVLTNPGKGDAVGQASMTAGADKGWLAVGPDVLAHTKMIEPGQKDTIEFTAPSKPGDYPFICTFPGHYMSMKGVLTVK